MRPEFDDKDKAILADRVAAWDAKQGPRVGDFVHMLDGTLRRFTHDHGNDIQTTGKGQFAADVSFYFGVGYMSFLGTLDRAIPKASLEQTDETAFGGAWFFHHDQAGAHCGVYFTVNCRVYRQQA